MENNNHFDEVLVKYLFNEETNQEKVFVENWVNSSEENRHYFNQLQKAWQLMEVKLTLDCLLNDQNLEEKWNRFEQDIIKAEGGIFSLNREKAIDVEQLEEETGRRKPFLYKLLRLVAVAASVIFVISLGWKFFARGKMDTVVAVNTEKNKDEQRSLLRHEVNKFQFQ